MSTNRPTLAEFSLEWRENEIKGQKFESNKHAAYDDHRRLQAAPVEDHTARIARIENGETVAPYADRDSQIRAAANRCHDMKEVCELHTNKSRAIKHKALTALCKSLLPEQYATLKRAAGASLELHASLRDYQDLKDYLIAQGGLVGICLTDTERVFGHPNDRTSDFAMLLREFIALGVLDRMPKSLA
jgi:hypothetical protein